MVDYKHQRTREERRNSNKMTQIRIFPSEPWERHSDSTPDDNSTSSGEGAEWVNGRKSFRSKISYRPKPDLKDLFASAARRRSDDEKSSSSSSDDEGNRDAVESASEMGVIHPYKYVGQSFIPESPQHGKKKRKSVKSSERKMKSSLRSSSEKQENPVTQDPEEPWYEVGDEVTFNVNNVGVAGIGTVMDGGNSINK
jgi:hypothetical protein